MAKSAKYTSYEAWVLGRIARCKSKMMMTSSLMKIPKYIRELEAEPSEYDLEKRLRALRDGGKIDSLNKRWYLRAA